MNRGGSFNQFNHVPCWDTTFINGRSPMQLENCGRFYGTTMRFPAAPHPNDFNRYPFQQPRLPLVSQLSQRPMYNNSPLDQRFSPNNRARPFYGRGCRRQQERMEDFNSRGSVSGRPTRIMLQNYSKDRGPHFRGAFQNPSQGDVIQGPMLPLQRPALLPLPSHFINDDAGRGRRSPTVHQCMDLVPGIDVVDHFKPTPDAALKGYTTVKHFETPLNLGHPIFKGNEQWPQKNGVNGRVISMRREEKQLRQLDVYPQLPKAAHNFLRQMDSDTEIMAYFEVEMRLFRKKTVVNDTLVHLVLTKDLKTGENSINSTQLPISTFTLFLACSLLICLACVVAFSKSVLLKADLESNILAYRSAINRSMNINVVGNISLSLESDELEEFAVFNFQNFQECQRFQSLFSRQKSMSLRKRVSDGGIGDMSEKRSKDYSPCKQSEPIAWITKLPPEIAKFHASGEKEPEIKKIPSSDDFIYDSSTFSNALNKSASKMPVEGGCGKESRQDSPCNFGQENKTDVNNNDDIIFSAKNVCLLMKPDPDSVDYRSPGYGTLAVIKNENNYQNQLDFIDNSGALKCRHYIDHSSLVKCEKSVGEVEFGCVWQAFAEVFNSPTPVRSIMHFKVIFSPSESGRFMNAMDDSVAKANRLARFDTWDNKNIELSSISTARYSL